MALPLKPPIQPQLARSKPDLPQGEDWVYEPKYDGFRAIAFVDGDECLIQSRGGKPLSRYFPELSFPSGRYVLDGEIVIDGDDGLQDFGALQNRIHPAASRIAMLAEETPAHYVAFDLLARDDETLLDLPLADRRAALEELVAEPITLTPLTREVTEAQPWLMRGEGVVAKDCRAPYRPGQRTGMVKVKRVRTIDRILLRRPGHRPAGGRARPPRGRRLIPAARPLLPESLESGHAVLPAARLAGGVPGRLQAGDADVRGRRGKVHPRVRRGERLAMALGRPLGR